MSWRANVDRFSGGEAWSEEMEQVLREVERGQEEVGVEEEA